MTDLFAARVQMAMSLGFHIIFAAVGVALPLLLVIAEALWLTTNGHSSPGACVPAVRAPAGGARDRVRGRCGALGCATAKRSREEGPCGAALLGRALRFNLARL
jgi:hypothetical protein